ncbi:MAG: energy transducer TonB [Aliarcobacter sp.]|nr:energy transducer TonB [Aliarcobacter sp.]
MILTISAHLVLFANLKVDEEMVMEEKPVQNISKINLQNVVIKKPEPIHEPVVEKTVEKNIETKPLPKTLSKNMIKENHKKINEVVKKEDVPKKVENVKVVEASKQPPLTSENKETKIDSNEKDLLENEYLSKLQQLIEQNKTYPKSAKRLNQMGKVNVCFVISKDGQIKDIKVVKKSDFEKLDEAAIEIFARIYKFEPIPEKLNKSSWEITVPIVYQITRS